MKIYLNDIRRRIFSYVMAILGRIYFYQARRWLHRKFTCRWFPHVWNTAGVHFVDDELKSNGKIFCGRCGILKLK